MSVDFSKVIRGSSTAILNGVSDPTAAPTDSTSGVVLRKGPNSGPTNVSHLLEIKGSTGITISAGAYVAGYCTDKSTWYKIYTLNGGSAITVSAAVGFAEVVKYLGLYDRVTVVGTLSTGTISIDCIELLASHVR